MQTEAFQKTLEAQRKILTAPLELDILQPARSAQRLQRGLSLFRRQQSYLSC